MKAAPPEPERVKVLAVSEPGFAGVKRHVVELLSELDLARFEVCFVYSLGRKDALFLSEIDRLWARGVRCREVPMARGIHALKDLAALLRLMRIVAEFQPDIVHSHSSKAGFLSRVAARLVRPRAKTLYSPHAMSCLYSRVYWFLEKMAGYLTDCLIAVSRSEAQDFRKWRIPARQIVTIPLNVRAQECYPAAAPRTDGSILVASCGRISHQKNGLLFFQAAVEVMRTHPEVRFRWIGSFNKDGEARKVRRFMDSEPLARKIEVTGWVTDADALIAEADIFCILSRYESFGYVAADAMMMLLPVVATRVTGLVDLIVDGETGFLCEPSPEEIAARLVELIESPGLRARMGRSGRERVKKNFRLDLTVRRIEELYCSQAGRPAGATPAPGARQTTGVL